MMEILSYIIVAGLGIFVGIVFKTWLIHRTSDYSGTIVIDKVSGKTIYSLVLDDYPEKIAFKKQILFKVDAPEESSDRK